MDARIVVETAFEIGTTRTHQLGRLSRPFPQAQPEEIGLVPEDARTILAQLQQAILLDQIEKIS